jgi:MYXO-CTERM domain-containing protein
VSAGEKLLGAGALVMALCCAVLPLAGAAVGGGLIAGTGTAGAVVGGLLLVGVVALVLSRRRRTGGGCRPRRGT